MPTNSPRRKLVFIPLALLVAIGLGAAGWWTWWAPRTKQLPSRWPAVVQVLAGDGISQWQDGDLSRARFSEPFGIAVAPDGIIYVADGGDSRRIRAISRDGRVFTVAPDASFDMPSGIAVDAAGAIYVADTGNNAIRKIGADGRVSTVAGDGSAGRRDGPASQARFNGPVGIALDGTGRVLVADTYNDGVRAIAPDGTVTTVAGTGAPGYVDGPAAYTQFDTPAGLAVDRAGNILVADTGNNAIRIIDPRGMVSTPAASVSAGLVRPTGIAIGAGGEAFITEERGRIVEIDRSGVVRTIAGSSPGFQDGPGADARFRRPAGIAVAAEGRLLVADAGNALVRLVSARDRLDLRVPPSPFIAPRFDVQAFGRTPLLWPAAPMDGPHEIAGTMGEVRGAEGSERFHAGVDVRVEEGTPVLAVRDGLVTSAAASGDFGSLNEWLRIGDVAYVHVRVGRMRNGSIVDPDRFVATYDDSGAVVRVRVRRGARFRAGDTIASANPFNHVHLNVGWPGEEHNALQFRLPQFEDRRPPTIARGGVKLFDEAGQPLVERIRGRVRVSGRVRVVVDAWDQADGNRPGRRLGLYAVGYRVLNRDGSPASGFEVLQDTIRFDQLSLSPDAARVVYAPGSGIPFYGRRVTRFLYIATNIFRDGVVATDYWDTRLLPPGDYVLRVLATDIQGNVASRDLPVTIVASADAQ